MCFFTNKEGKVTTEFSRSTHHRKCVYYFIDLIYYVFIVLVRSLVKQSPIDLSTHNVERPQLSSLQIPANLLTFHNGSLTL